MSLIIIFCILISNRLVNADNKIQDGVSNGGKNGNPGVKLRITQNGLNYVNDVVRQQMAIIIPKLRIDEMTFTQLGGSATLTNGRVTDYKAPDVQTMTLHPPNQIIVVSKNMMAATTGHIDARLGLLSDAGDYDGRAENIDTTYTIKLIKQPSGQLGIKTVNCKAQVGKFDVNIYNTGPLGKMIQAMKGLMISNVKPQIVKQICAQGTQYFDDIANKQLSATPTKIWLNETDPDKFAKSLISSHGNTNRQGSQPNPNPANPNSNPNNQGNPNPNNQGNPNPNNQGNNPNPNNQGNPNPNNQGNPNPNNQGNNPNNQGNPNPSNPNNNPNPNNPGNNPNPNQPNPNPSSSTRKPQNDKDIEDLMYRSKNISRHLMLDYANTKDPVCTNTYLETYSKGEISYHGEGGTPFYPNDFHEPNPYPTDRAVYAVVSDYVINSMFYQAFIHDLFKYRISAEETPDLAQYLQTTCDGDFLFGSLCLGTLIPQLQESFPNSKAEIYLEANPQAPAVFFQQDGLVRIRALMTVTLNAKKDNERRLIAIADMDVTAKARLYIDKQKIKGNVTVEKNDLKMRTNNIKNFNDKNVQDLAGSTKSLMEVTVNGYLKKGFPLPISKAVKLVNAKINVYDRTIRIDSDVEVDQNILSKMLARAIEDSNRGARVQGIDTSDNDN